MILVDDGIDGSEGRDAMVPDVPGWNVIHKPA